VSAIIAVIRTTPSTEAIEAAITTTGKKKHTGHFNSNEPLKDNHRCM